LLPGNKGDLHENNKTARGDQDPSVEGKSKSRRTSSSNESHTGIGTESRSRGQKLAGTFGNARGESFKKRKGLLNRKSLDALGLTLLIDQKESQQREEKEIARKAGSDPRAQEKKEKAECYVCYKLAIQARKGN